MSRDASQFWPQTWLVESFPNARILTISYHSSGACDMFLTAENLLVSLTMDGVRLGRSGCPVVFVGHSLGGLILKELCIFASDTMSRKSREKLGAQRVHDLFSNLRGMFFYGTPQTGSVLGDMLHALLQGEGAPIEEIEILKASNARRNEHFSDLKSRHNWVTFGLGETRETYLQILGKHVHVSPEASTRPGMDQYYSIDANHHDICRPTEKNDNIFLLLEQFLRQIQKGGVLQAEDSADLKSGRPDYVVDDEGRAEKLEHLLSQPDIQTVFVRGFSGVGKTAVAQQVFRNLSSKYDVLCFLSLDTLSPASIYESDQVLKDRVVTRIVEFLSPRESKDLFSHYAFNGQDGPDHLRRVIQQVIDKWENHPLSLKVGSIGFCEEEEWLELLGKLNRAEEVDAGRDRRIWGCSALIIFRILRRKCSWILPVFHGSRLPVVECIWEKIAGHSTKVPWSNLKQRFLASTDDDPLRVSVILIKMHQLLRDLGQSVACPSGDRIEKWRRIPEASSRWEEIEEVEGKMETLALKLNTDVENIMLKQKSFLKCHRLQYLVLEGEWRVPGRVDLPERLELPKPLVYLRWLDGFFTVCPVDFTSLAKLVVLELVNCSWMTSLPPSLVKVKALRWLELEGCQLLSELAPGLSERLEYLGLDNSSLENLPDDLRRFKNLNCLKIHSDMLTRVPEGVGDLRSLSEFHLSGREVTTLPESIGGLKVLKKLKVRCSSLSLLPDSIGQLRNLDEVMVEDACLKGLPLALFELCNLSQLCLDYNPFETVPMSIGRLANLELLSLYSTGLKCLPESVGDLRKLTELRVDNTALETVPDSICELRNLDSLILSNTSLKCLPKSLGDLHKLAILRLSNTLLESVPDSIGGLINLETLILGNTSLKFLPESVGDLRKLTELRLNNTLLETVPNSIGKLHSLRHLDLRDTKIQTLPDTMGDLNLLFELRVSSAQWKAWPESLGKLHPEYVVAPISSFKGKSGPATIGDLNLLSELRLSFTKWRAWPESLEKLHPDNLVVPITSFEGSCGAASQTGKVEGQRGNSCPSNFMSAQEEGDGEEMGTSSSWSEEMEGMEEESLLLETEIGISHLRIYSLAFERVVDLTLNGRWCLQSWLQPLFCAMQQPRLLLQTLTLQDFIVAEQIPHEIIMLARLRNLTVTGWSRLRELPMSLGELRSLENLHLQNNPELRKLPDSLGSLSALKCFTILQCKCFESMPLSFTQKSPLDESFDMGDESQVTSDSWRVLESFFACCGLRIPRLLSYAVEDRKMGEATRESGLFRLDNKVFMVLFDEGCLHHRKLNNDGDRSPDEGSGPEFSVPFLSNRSRSECRVGCGFQDYRNALILKLDTYRRKTEQRIEYGFSQGELLDGTP